MEVEIKAGEHQILLYFVFRQKADFTACVCDLDIAGMHRKTKLAGAGEDLRAEDFIGRGGGGRLGREGVDVLPEFVILHIYGSERQQNQDQAAEDSEAGNRAPDRKPFPHRV